jgi:hypothetical protein
MLSKLNQDEHEGKKIGEFSLFFIALRISGISSGTMIEEIELCSSPSFWLLFWFVSELALLAGLLMVSEEIGILILLDDKVSEM